MNIMSHIPEIKYEELNGLLKFLDFYQRLDEMNTEEAEKYLMASEEIQKFYKELSNIGFIIVFDWVSWLNQNEMYKNIENNIDEHLRKADLDTLRKLMTSYIRGDRFNEGLFKRVILNGHVTKILLRLRELIGGDRTMSNNKLLRMDNVGIVVESLDVAISFFEEIGLSLEGRATIEGEWAGRVTGLGSQCVEIATMVTPDGHSRLELSRFLTPPTISDHRTAPVNSLGYLRVMFTVQDIDEMLSRLTKYGAQLVGEVVQYGDSYRLCYIRGIEGLLIGLAEELGNK